MNTHLPGAEKILSNWQEQRYTRLPKPVSQARYEQAATAFIQATQVKREFLDRLTFLEIPDKRGSDRGIVFSDRKAGDTDDKVYAHVNRAFLERNALLLKNADPRLLLFLERAMEIFEAMEAQFWEIFSEMDVTFPGIRSQFFDKERHFLEATMRFLLYTPIENSQVHNPYLAKPHYDISCFTCAHTENMPGLRLGTKESLHDMDHTSDSVLLFPGMGMQQILEPYGAAHMAPAAYHDVIRTNKPQQRWSIVSFIGSPVAKEPERYESRPYLQTQFTTV